VDGVSANVTELSAEPGASGRMEIGRTNMRWNCRCLS